MLFFNFFGQHLAEDIRCHTTCPKFACSCELTRILSKLASFDTESLEAYLGFPMPAALLENDLAEPEPGKRYAIGAALGALLQERGPRKVQVHGPLSWLQKSVAKVPDAEK